MPRHPGLFFCAHAEECGYARTLWQTRAAVPKTKAILGLSAYYHDSAAALVVDGRIVAAAQEERFSRVKHDHRFPRLAVDYCLREAGLRPADLDHVVFYEKPFLKFERILETHLSVAPAGF